MERGKIIEIFLGMAFIVLLFITSLTIIYNSENPHIYQTNIQNTYNTNIYLINKPSPIINDYEHNKIHLNNNYKEIALQYKKIDYLIYSEHLKDETYFINYKDEFRVYVVNKGYEDMYFRVKFYFCDYNKNCFSETMHKYIRVGEKKVFTYVDIHDKKNKYYTWEYRVFSENR